MLAIWFQQERMIKWVLSCALGFKGGVSPTLTHLGHILQSDLNDDADILRATKELIKKANFVLKTFSCADVSIKCKLLKTYCLSLYGCPFYGNCGVSLVILIVELFTVLLKILV